MLLSNCIACATGFHNECFFPDGITNLCCCSDDPDATVTSSAPVDTIATGEVVLERKGKSADQMQDPISTGRKRAAAIKPISKGMRCEWAGLRFAGGGVIPIVGCFGSPATNIHHGPDKDVLNNTEDNLHRICSSCLGPSMRILMADLTWKRADEVKTGDEIISFSENLKHGETRYEYAVIESIREVTEPSYEFITAKGHSLISSHAHQWVASSPNRHHLKWRKTEDIKEGFNLRFVVEPWEPDRSWESGWFAGILDGEGCLNQSQLSVSQKDDSVCDAIQDYITEGNVHYTYRPENGKWNPTWVFRVTNVPDILRIIGITRPVKYMDKVRKMLTSKNFAGQYRSPLTVKNNRTPITRKNYIGMQKVYSIQTSSKTMIVEGYLSHNCHNRWHSLNDIFYGERPTPGTGFTPVEHEMLEHDDKTKAPTQLVFESELWWETKDGARKPFFNEPSPILEKVEEDV